jgi:hypothetical protein
MSGRSGRSREDIQPGQFVQRKPCGVATHREPSTQLFVEQHG